MLHPGHIKVLIGCETSGMVRNAFLRLGFDAWSCDLMPAEDRTNRHIRGDIRRIMHYGWDLMAVMHPPCTRLCNSGVRWLETGTRKRTRDELWADLEDGAALFSDCWNAPIQHVAIENPVMHKHARERIRNYRPAAQHVQPWWFGDPFFKSTGLYLRNLPELVETDRLVPPKRGTPEHKAWSKIARMPPGPNRSTDRSRTFPGIANAMAAQWGDFLLQHQHQQQAAA